MSNLWAEVGMRMRFEPTPELLDREAERAALDGLLGDLRSGRGRALVVWGVAGVGKSALLEYLAGAAADMRVARAAGVESEMELAFASLHQLCAPLLGRLEDLPGPQRDALGIAFGLRAGAAPDRFLVGLAGLTLLSEAAEDRPLLCLVDDAQWLDRASAQVLAFAARRLLAEPVGLIFAAREPGEQFGGLPNLQVRGLPDRDARTLLHSTVRFRLDEQIRDRIVAETAGNPLALLELPRGLSPAQLAGGLGLAGALPARIEQGFRQRLEALPADTRSLLLVAAAEPTGDPVLIWQTTGQLGIPAAATAAAQADGLLQAGTRVQFRHPLVRSAVYSAASPPERRAAHRALAEVTDRDRDPDRRAWHLAAATPGPDEEVAAELERSAGRAQARGGMAAAAAFLQRAVELTAESARRSERALAAAQASLQAGAFDAAAELLAIAAAGPLDEFQQACVDLVRAQLAFVSNRGSDAPRLLLAAARRLERVDIRLARATYLDTINAAMFAGHLAGPGAGVAEVSRAARSAPPPPGLPRASDLLLDGLAINFTEGYRAGLPVLQQALDAFGHEMSAEEELRWLWLACIAALHLWDDGKWDALSRRHVELARQVGALGELPLALSSRVYMLLFAGELAAAASLTDEVQAATEATGSNLAPYGALGLAALRGLETEASALIRATGQEVASRGEGIGVTLTNWANAVLYNATGRYDQALAAAEQGSECPDELGLAAWSMVELIEAATRTGQQPGRAADTLRFLSEITSAAGTDWALGIQARSRALLADRDSAERLYLEAIERLDRTRVRLELARAHLVYGEWLRREDRRADARAQLRTAHDMFAVIGMQAFAERARRELRATGEIVRRRAATTRGKLTPQEAQIARLARSGLSNPEIAAQLFLSPHTVAYHLGKVFTKLEISSRHQLRQALPDSGRDGPMA
jgi:DNA-binding CsgD family transcriptional regulator